MVFGFASPSREIRPEPYLRKPPFLHAFRNRILDLIFMLLIRCRLIRRAWDQWRGSSKTLSVGARNDLGHCEADSIALVSTE